MDAIRRALLALALSPALLAGRAPAALAADPAPAASPTPEQVRQLLGLLADPAVRDWIARGAAAPPAAAPAPGPDEPVTLGQYLRERLAAIRAHLVVLAAAIPTVPDELAHAWLILSLEFEEQGLFSVVLLIAAFGALGF